jgi:hypothetical protein
MLHILLELILFMHLLLAEGVAEAQAIICRALVPLEVLVALPLDMFQYQELQQ